MKVYKIIKNDIELVAIFYELEQAQDFIDYKATIESNLYEVVESQYIVAD